MEEAMFCSSFVVGFWKTLIQDMLYNKQKQLSFHKDDEASGQAQQTRQIIISNTHNRLNEYQKADMESFIEKIDPMNCTPTDLKYFVRYFPHLFEFSPSFADIKRGAILKTNFLGPPRYGHAMIALSDSALLKDKETGMMFSKVRVGSFGRGFHEFYMLFPVNRNTEKNYRQIKNLMQNYVDRNFVRRDGSFHMYVLNPKTEISLALLNTTKKKARQTARSYSTIGAAASAFHSCFRDRQFFSYARQRATGQIARNRLMFRHYYTGM